MNEQIYLPDLEDSNQLRLVLSNFFVGNKLLKEKLRRYILENLSQILISFEKINLQPQQDFWVKIKNISVVTHDEVAKKTVSQILSLAKNLTETIKESVEDSQRFEFFILSKASEISSGDKDKDYYMALKIRNDQLLAFLYVYTQSLNNLTVCLENKPEEILTIPQFRFFGEKDIKIRVYEIADYFYQQRIKLGII